MARQPRLVLNDDKLYPVAGFFNSLWDQNFLEVMSQLAAGIGHGINGATCLFPDPDDPDDPPFEGAKFSVASDEVILSEKEWKAYARMAIASYIKANPNDEPAASEISSRLA